MVGYAAPSLSDLTDAHSAACPLPNAKTAGWLLGHLCVSGDYIRRKCGRPPLTPKEWGPQFGPGTKPSIEPADYPPMSALRETFEKVYLDLAASAPSLTDEQLAMPNPLELTRARFPTFGDFATFIMTAHLGYHLGQLTGWRAAAAMPLRPGALSAI